LVVGDHDQRVELPLLDDALELEQAVAHVSIARGTSSTLSALIRGSGNGAAMRCRCVRRAVSLSQLFPFSGGVIAKRVGRSQAVTKDPQGRFYSENAKKLCLQAAQRSLTNEAPENR
jgi:hypothetical protein